MLTYDKKTKKVLDENGIEVSKKERIYFDEKTKEYKTSEFYLTVDKRGFVKEWLPSEIKGYSNESVNIK